MLQILSSLDETPSLLHILHKFAERVKFLTNVKSTSYSATRWKKFPHTTGRKDSLLFLLEIDTLTTTDIYIMLSFFIHCFIVESSFFSTSYHKLFKNYLIYIFRISLNLSHLFISFPALLIRRMLALRDSFSKL